MRGSTAPPSPASHEKAGHIPISAITRRGTEARRNDPLARELARILNNYRRRKRLSIEDVARESGIPGNDIRRFESATHAPDIPQLRKLAAVFGVETYRIVGRIDAFFVRLAESERATHEAVAS